MMLRLLYVMTPARSRAPRFGRLRTTVLVPRAHLSNVKGKYLPSPGTFVASSVKKRDVIIIGGGHNGLVSAAYLARAGLNVLVLERRHIVGGAAVTEELIPGFRFSRASYLAGLLRPQIVKELGLENHGFKYISRDPSSFTPSRGNKYLMLGADDDKNWNSIAQFSKKDADNFPRYEAFLGQIREIIEPLLDSSPPNLFEGKYNEKLQTLRTMSQLIRIGSKNHQILIPFYELFTAPASHILDRWFDSEILKATLATDAVIGAMVGPKQAGSAYVLLHHIMGEAAGRKGVWAYIEGGMGAVSNALASAGKERGVEIITNATVSRLLHEAGKVTGVLMEDGTKLEADYVLSNATPYHTFLELLPKGNPQDGENKDEISPLPAEFKQHIEFSDYGSGVMKINCALDSLPNFLCCPTSPSGLPGPQHFGTIHFEETVKEIDDAFLDAQMGKPSNRPIIEMTIPSSLDKTLCPEGKHVCSLFVQYAPYDIDPKLGTWADSGFKEAYADRVFSIIDEKAPGFSASVIGKDVLSPLDLEQIFGLHRGNIFHGSLSLHQLGYTRPAIGYSSHRTPLKGLYICGAGAHPGGGVMGAPGRNCAKIVLSDLNRG